MKRNLNFWLIVGGILAVVIPLIVVGPFSVYRSSRALNNLSRDQAVRLARSLADIADGILSQEIKLAEQLAAANATVSAAVQVATATGVSAANAAVAALDDELAAAMARIGDEYETIFLTNQGGVIIADGTKGGYKGISVADRAYFQKGIQGTANIGDPVISKKTQNPVIPICVPVYSAGREIAGVLTTVVELSVIQQYILSMTIGQTGYAFVVNAEGKLLIHPDPELVMNLNLREVPGMAATLENIFSSQRGIDEYRFKGSVKIAGYATVKSTGWRVCITQDAEEFLAASRQIGQMVFMVGTLFLLLAVLGFFCFARRISRPIMRSTQGLNQLSQEVSLVSQEVLTGSQTVAEGVSKQAASLEETAASLEELSNMVRQNADHAAQADQLMQETRRIVADANAFMRELAGSIQAIEAAAEQIRTIVRTIEDIAFRANLLALNAAVEAARAGEAGLGFTVVADEERNLAVRASQEAQNIAGLIETSLQRVEKGVRLTEQTDSAFSRVSEHMDRSSSLVGEIAAASDDQARGIEELNRAVAEIDRVVQQNAATAEQSAAASDQMKARIEQLKTIVRDLIRLTGEQ